MTEELSQGNHYEALQFVQSFIARKKKTMTANTASKVLFHGAKLLMGAGQAQYTGALLEWYALGGRRSCHYSTHKSIVL